MYNKLLFVSALLLISCSTQETQPEAETQTISVSQSAIGSVETLFPDTESRAVLHSDKYDFSTTEMLRIEPLNDSQFTVTNFIPVHLTDITITASLGTTTPVLELCTIDSVPAHTKMTLPYPVTSSFKSTDGAVVVIDPSMGFPVTATELTYLPTTPLLEMTKAITVEWRATFHDFLAAQPDHKSWRPVYPAHARLYTLLLLNTSYLFSQQDYIDRFLSEEYYKSFVDSTREVLPEEWLTLEEKENLYYNKIVDKSFNLGIVSGGGLGGGSTLGISNGTLTNQFNFKWDDSLETLDYLPNSYYTGPHPLLSHELGHCFGYGHGSNMCSVGRRDVYGTEGWDQLYGFPAVGTLMHGKYVHYDLLPISKDEYYNPSDFDFSLPADDSEYQ